jgi:endonuclease/exonuclease/phosphatase family metal-dependent hydrolase
MSSISILTLNLHKGFSQFGTKFVLEELRTALRAEKADLVFLQEVVGENRNHADTTIGWPETSQYEFLADQVWSAHSYARNAVYQEGHHGNAILSKFPIVSEEHHIISAHAMEQRGILHVKVKLGESGTIDLVCVHLGLLEKWRQRQLKWISEYIDNQIARDAPLILAGDFNDWRGRAGGLLFSQNQLIDPYFKQRGKLAKTYPALLPALAMDRIYFRNLNVRGVKRIHSGNWRILSDHLPLVAEFDLGGDE